MYFESVRRIEGLKIYLEEKVEPNSWDDLYAIRIPLENLAQHTFLLVMSMYSKHFAELLGKWLKWMRSETDDTYRRIRNRPRAKGNSYELVITPNRAFAVQYDSQRLISTPNTTNVVKYALLWMSHALYESQVASFIHLRRPLNQLPEPSAIGRERFVSLQVKREQMLAQEKRELLKDISPLALRAIIDSLQVVMKTGGGFVIDRSFVNTLDQLRGYKRDDDKFIQTVVSLREDEMTNFESALIGILGLLPFKNWVEESEFAVREAKKMLCAGSSLTTPIPTEFARRRKCGVDSVD